MNVLVTGGAGFIGSHLCEALLHRGHRVLALDDLSTGRHENIQHLVGHDFEFTLGSVLDADLVDDQVARADVVFHLAAAVGVELVVDRPLESLLTNIRGAEIVLEQAHEHGTRTLVTSTSEIYGKNTSDRLSEDDDRILGSPLKSRWSYSEAKAIEEILAYTYWKQKGLETVIVRLFNTVGPRQSGRYGMVIPRFVSQAIRGEALTIYGDGRQTRCFCYVGDAVEGLIALAEHPDAVGQAINLGTTEEVSIEELAHRVISLSSSSSTIRIIPYGQAYEEGFEDMPRRVPDTTRAEQLIGWAPKLDLDETLRLVIDEHRA